MAEIAAARVFALYIYPVKSLRGIALERADVLPSGFRNDRRFMLVDEDNAFVTQREEPALARVTTAIDGENLHISIDDSADRVAVPLGGAVSEGPRRSVFIWEEIVEAVDASAAASALLSEHLGRRCNLVFMPPDVVRHVDREYAREGERVGFADGFPVLIASLASLADLNARMTAPVGMDRFRPNIVVEGGEPWDEEGPHAQIGAVSFRTPKKCARCVITCTDQRSGVVGKEPLKTLATYRREGNKANFAMNAIPDVETSAEIRIGDPVSFNMGLRPKPRGTPGA